MKITIFTSNQARHLHLIDQLSEIADECYAVIESNTVFPGLVKDFFQKSETFQEYFSGVIAAERRVFGDIRFSGDSRNLVIKSGDLNSLARSVLEPALKSDVFVVFGASFIKGWLIDYLVSKRAVNIHMGVSPYYRGSSCNFWSLYDYNPHLMGATIHLLSKGLDSGDMLYHVAPTTVGCSNAFEFTMTAAKAAQQSLIDRLTDGSIFEYEPVKQNKDLEIRYTRNADFTDEIAREFLDRDLSIEQISELITEKKGLIKLLKPFCYS